MIPVSSFRLFQRKVAQPVLALLIPFLLMLLLFNDHSLSNSTESNASVDSNSLVSPRFAHCQNHHRIQHLEQFCRNHGYDYNKEFPSKGHHHKTSHIKLLLVDDAHQTIYCPVGKSGSTSWTSFFLVINGMSPDRVGSWDNIHDPDELERAGIRRLSDYTTSEITNRLENYFKFMVVRHPLDRLISAYNDKFLVDQDYRPSLKPYILDKYRHKNATQILRYYKELYSEADLFNETTNELKPPSTMDSPLTKSLRRFIPPFQPGNPNKVNFDEFLMYVTQDEKSYDHHWASYLDKCQPCLIRYDYIGKVETLNEDAVEIIRNMNKTGSLTYSHFRHTRASGDSSSVVNSGTHIRQDPMTFSKVLNDYREVHPKLLTNVTRLYRDDMDAFGYSWSRRDWSAYCSLPTTAGDITPCC